MKLKSKPSQRIKKRYLLIHGKKDEVEKAILDYLGILGYAKASPLFVNVNEKQGSLILAVDRAEINNIRAAFEIVKNVKVIKVSGTIKGLSKN
jgi:RNase P/RNase MRP subunit POP5